MCGACVCVYIKKQVYVVVCVCLCVFACMRACVLVYLNIGMCGYCVCVPREIKNRFRRKPRVSIFAAHYRYDGCWNGYDYDCCTHRRSNFYYPSLVKPFPYYYRCVHNRVVYGRCARNQCVTVDGRCGKCAEDKRITGVFRKLSSRSSFGQVAFMIRLVICRVTWFWILLRYGRICYLN